MELKNHWTQTVRHSANKTVIPENNKNRIAIHRRTSNYLDSIKLPAFGKTAVHANDAAAFMIDGPAAFRTGIGLGAFAFSCLRCTIAQAPLPPISLYFLITRAIASGQEVTLTPSRRIQAGQRMPLICSIIASTEMPERMAIDIKRAVASDCEEHPPCPPGIGKHFANTLLIGIDADIKVTAADFYFSVTPIVTGGLGLGTIAFISLEFPEASRGEASFAPAESTCSLRLPSL